MPPPTRRTSLYLSTRIVRTAKFGKVSIRWLFQELVCVLTVPGACVCLPDWEDMVVLYVVYSLYFFASIYLYGIIFVFTQCITWLPSYKGRVQLNVCYQNTNKIPNAKIPDCWVTNNNYDMVYFTKIYTDVIPHTTYSVVIQACYSFVKRLSIHEGYIQYNQFKKNKNRFFHVY